MKKVTIEQQKQALAEALQQVDELAKAKEIARIELEDNLIDGGADLLDQLDRELSAATQAHARAAARAEALGKRLAVDEATARREEADFHLAQAKTLASEIQRKVDDFYAVAAKLEPMRDEIYRDVPQLREHMVSARMLGAMVSDSGIKSKPADSAWRALKSVASIGSQTFLY